MIFGHDYNRLDVSIISLVTAFALSSFANDLRPEKIGAHAPTTMIRNSHSDVVVVPDCGLRWSPSTTPNNANSSQIAVPSFSPRPRKRPSRLPRSTKSFVPLLKSSERTLAYVESPQELGGPPSSWRNHPRGLLYMYRAPRSSADRRAPGGIIRARTLCREPPGARRTAELLEALCSLPLACLLVCWFVG